MRTDLAAAYPRELVEADVAEAERALAGVAFAPDPVLVRLEALPWAEREAIVERNPGLRLALGHYREAKWDAEERRLAEQADAAANASPVAG